MSVYKTSKADLKAGYQKHLKVSFIIALLLVIAAFRFSPDSKKMKVINEAPSEPILVDNIFKTRQESRPPEKLKPIQPVISLSDDIIDIEFENSEIDFTEDAIRLPDPVKDRIVENENVYYPWAEVMPEVIGGLQALQSKIYYTEFAKRAYIEGQVVVAAVIDENGDVIHAEIIKSLSKDF
jgi:periplasmic protein TonB